MKDTTCGKEPGCSLQSSMSNAVYMTSMCGGVGSWNNSPNITYREKQIQHYTKTTNPSPVSKTKYFATLTNKNYQHHIAIYLHNMVVKGYLIFSRVAEQLGSTVKEKDKKRERERENS